MAMSQRMWKREQERKRRERLRRARRRRNCTITVILIAIIAVIAVIGKSCYDNNSKNNLQSSVSQPSVTQAPKPVSSLIPVSELDTSFYDNAVFVGNSIADGIALYGLLPQTDIYAKVGLSLDSVYTTAADNDSTAIADQLKSRKYSKVFLCFGEAELSSKDTSDFEDKYSELIEKVKSYQQSARIYLVAIPPVSQDTEENGMDVRNITDYNDTIKKLAESEDVYYADAYTALADDDGYLKSGVSSDGINLNRDCYIEMLNYIADNSYIPDLSDLDSESDESSDDKDTADSDNSKDSSGNSKKEESTEKPSKSTESPKSDKDKTDSQKSTEDPEPTVNVLKDSAMNKSSDDSN